MTGVASSSLTWTRVPSRQRLPERSPTRAWVRSSWTKYSPPSDETGTQPVGAGVLQPHEQAEARHAGDAALERRAFVLGQEGGYVAVVGVALRRHGAALAGGDVLGRLGEARQLGVGEPVAPELQRADKGPVDHQVGVAADGRSEVGRSGPG